MFFLSAVCLIALLTLLGTFHLMLAERAKQSSQQIIDIQSDLLLDQRNLIQDLLNRLASRDPMTLAQLSGIYSTSDASEPLAPVGTDEAEFRKWAAYLESTGQGEILEHLTNDDASLLGDFLPQQPE